MVRTFKSEQGITILVGENAIENDSIRRRASQKSLWFHLDGLPSAHVLVIIERTLPTRETILDAAQLCKHFGKAQGLHRVKVNYLEVKYVARSPARKDGEVHLLKAPTTITISKDDARSH